MDGRKRAKKRGRGAGASSLEALQARLRGKLAGSRFRMLNERLYTQTGAASLRMFTGDPSAFEEYHEGFRSQVERWPVNPLDLLIKRVSAMPRGSVVADMGCGEARLSREVPHKVHSFDLVAANKRVTACNIAHVPLEDASVDAVVFCLALMGTDYVAFLREGRRLLRDGGLLLIAEVRSRLEDGDDDESREAGVAGFVATVERAGFRVGRVNRKNKMFIQVEARAVARPAGSVSAAAAAAAASDAPGPAPGDATLHACRYKRR